MILECLHECIVKKGCLYPLPGLSVQYSHIFPTSCSPQHRSHNSGMSIVSALRSVCIIVVVCHSGGKGCAVLVVNIRGCAVLE